MEKAKYLFIDGEYVHRRYHDAMNAVFSVPGDLNVWKLVQYANVFRTYYYDCLDDAQKDGESKSAFESRIESQKAYLSQIGSLPGVHLRTGTVVGRQRRQKEVDVLLAVDMLTHGSNGSMGQAVLLAGDLDFRPVVDALVRVGVYVVVWYEKTSGSKELYFAADQGLPIDWNTLYLWSTDAFIAANLLPERTSATSNPYLTTPQIGAGTFPGGTVELLSPTDQGPFTLIASWPGGRSELLKHSDRNVLLRYFSVLHARITWKSLREG